MVSTHAPDGRVIADGWKPQEPQGTRFPDLPDLGGRRYSQRDVDLLRQVQRLSQDEGVNLAGIKRIIELTNQVEALQSRLREMAEELTALRANQRRDVALVPKSTAVVVWQPRKTRG